MGSTHLVAEDNDEYSDSNVDRKTSVCRNDFQIKGHGPKKIINPDLDLADVESVDGSILYNPAKSAST